MARKKRLIISLLVILLPFLVLASVLFALDIVQSVPADIIVYSVTVLDLLLLGYLRAVKLFRHGTQQRQVRKKAGRESALKVVTASAIRSAMTSMKYVFLFLLLISALSAVDFPWLGEFSSMVRQYQFMTATCVVLAGLITLYLHRKAIFKLESEADKANLEEEGRTQEFPARFPTIQSIPVFGSLAKWMYREGWWFSILIILALVLGAYARYANITNVHYTSDEIGSIIASQRILDKGLPIYPSGLHYFRSVLYHYVLSPVLLVGTSEIVTRSLNLFLSLITIIVVYFLSKSVSNKEVGIISAYLVSLSPLFVGLSNYTRPYQFWQLCVVLTAYFGVLWYQNDRVLLRNLFIAGTFACVLSHELSVFLLPVFIWLVLAKFAVRKKERSLTEVIILTVLIVTTSLVVPLLNLVPPGVVINEQGESYKSQLFFNTNPTSIGSMMRNETQYFNELFFDSVFIGVILFSSFLLVFYRKRVEFSVLLSAVLLPFFAMPLIVSSQQPRYFYNVFPFYFIALSLITYLILKIVFAKARMVYVLVPLILPLTMSFYMDRPDLVNPAEEVGNYDAHKYLIENAGAEDIIISVNPATTYFYLGRVDYFFYQREWKVFITEEGDIYNKQIDAPWISTSTELEDIMKSQYDVWLVTDHRYPGRFSKDTVNWVNKNFDLQYSSPLHPSKVYANKKKEI